MVTRRIRWAAVLCVAAGVLYPKEAWVSGGLRIYGVARYHTVAIEEKTYSFGEDPPPSKEYLQGEVKKAVVSLSMVSGIVGRWVDEKVKSRRLSVVPIKIESLQISRSSEDHAEIRPGGDVILPLKECSVGTWNYRARVSLSLPLIPSTEALRKLEGDICEALAKVPSHLDDKVVPFRLLPAERRTASHVLFQSIDRIYAAPDLYDRYARDRRRVFDRATKVCQDTLSRLEREGPFGLRLGGDKDRRGQPGRVGVPIFFSMVSHLIDFEVRAEESTAKTGQQDVKIAVSNGLYAEWRKAGLPRAISIATLLEERKGKP